jgi:beta-1,4-mannosyltransferase
MTGPAPARVAVVVLGELARSPRVLNHARALAGRGHAVALAGYCSRPLEELAGARILRLHPLQRAGDRASQGWFLLWSGARMGLLAIELLWRLLRERPAFILVQNPPSLPALTVTRWAAILVRARLIVDWHNYGYSLLALRLGSTNRMVRLARWYEFHAGRRAAAHLCVSEAMRADLERAGIRARVLYDIGLAPASPPQPRTAGHPLLVVCPAGWTADENMELLAQALAIPWDAPAIELHVTGDGPTRERLAPRLEALSRPGLAIHTGFLPATEYRDLLGQASLGLSLHNSSSGLDLAMKVADMFEARLPVLAFDYAGALPEQIRDGETGFIFADAAELAALLARIARDPAPLDQMRRNIAQQWTETWDQAWQREAGPLFETVKSPHT